MNKYQELALKYSGYAVYKNEDLSDKIDRYTYIKPEEAKIRIVQDENYNITKYYLRFQTGVHTVIVGKKVYEQQELKITSNPSVIVPIDFNSKINEVKLCYDGAVEPITIKLEYISADKEAYNQKVKAQIIEENSKKINPECKTGKDLVNIYWDIADRSVLWAELNIYLLTNGHERKVVSYKEKSDITFKSITGLANGTYLYEIIELGLNSKLIAKTDRIKFTIGAISNDFPSNAR